MMKVKYTAMPDFREEIGTIVRRNFAPAALGEKLGAYHEKDIALALESLNREARSRLLRALPEEMLNMPKTGQSAWECWGFASGPGCSPKWMPPWRRSYPRRSEVLCWS